MLSIFVFSCPRKKEMKITGMRTLLYTDTLQALAREISTLRGAFEERKPLRMREGLLKAIALSLFLE